MAYAAINHLWNNPGECLDKLVRRNNGTGKATLKDASVVDLLRHGGPFKAVRPPGGFSSLPTIAGIRFSGNCQNRDKHHFEKQLQQGLLLTGIVEIESKAVQTLEIYFTQVVHESKSTANEFPQLNEEGIAENLHRIQLYDNGF